MTAMSMVLSDELRQCNVLIMFSILPLFPLHRSSGKLSFSSGGVALLQLPKHKQDQGQVVSEM